MTNDAIKEIVEEMIEWGFKFIEEDFYYEEIKECLGACMGYDLEEFRSDDILNIYKELKKRM